jgi:hypothetical protein
MIEVIYQEGSRLGNRMYQYAIARELAINLGYELVNEPLDIFPATREKVSGADYSLNGSIEITGQVYDFQSLIDNPPEKKIIVNGYFQRYEYYSDMRESLKEWFHTPDVEFPVGVNDCLVFIRRTDYFLLDSVLTMGYYDECIKRAGVDKVYVTTDDFADPWIKKFIERYSAIPLQNNVSDTFAIARKFKKIVLSQSTFAWWCAFLSDAQEIYYPIPKKGFWSDMDKRYMPSIAECMNWTDEITNIDLKVNEDRYIYIQTSEYIMSAEDREYYSDIMPKPYLVIGGRYESFSEQYLAMMSGIAYAHHNNFAYKHLPFNDVEMDSFTGLQSDVGSSNATVTLRTHVEEVYERPYPYYTKEVLNKIKDYYYSTHKNTQSDELKRFHQLVLSDELTVIDRESYCAALLSDGVVYYNYSCNLPPLNDWVRL